MPVCAVAKAVETRCCVFRDTKIPRWYYQFNTNTTLIRRMRPNNCLKTNEIAVRLVIGIKVAWHFRTIGTILARNWSSDKTTGVGVSNEHPTIDLAGNGDCFRLVSTV